MENRNFYIIFCGNFTFFDWPSNSYETPIGWTFTLASKNLITKIKYIEIQKTDSSKRSSTLPYFGIGFRLLRRRWRLHSPKWPSFFLLRIMLTSHSLEVHQKFKESFLKNFTKNQLMLYCCQAQPELLYHHRWAQPAAIDISGIYWVASSWEARQCSAQAKTWGTLSQLSSEQESERII